MGSRSTNNEKAAEWVKKNGTTASQGIFADTAKFGEWVRIMGVLKTGAYNFKIVNQR